MKSSMILLPSPEKTRGPQVKFPHAIDRVVLGWILAIVCPPGPPRHIATTTWAQREQREVRVVKTPPDLIKLRIEEKLSSAEESMQPSKSCNYHNDNTQTQHISKYNDTIITHHHHNSAQRCNYRNNTAIPAIRLSQQVVSIETGAAVAGASSGAAGSN